MGMMVEHPIPFTKVQKGEELSPEEQTMIASWAYKTFLNMESTYLHHREGLVQEDVYEARKRGFTEMMNSSSYAAHMRDTWQAASKFAFADEFVRQMNDEIIRQSSNDGGQA